MTYTNDSATGLQYADQRYYASNWGRFMSPDPYTASAGLANPSSWNRYTYVECDPIDSYDPRGPFSSPPGSDGQGGYPFCTWLDSFDPIQCGWIDTSFPTPQMIRARTLEGEVDKLGSIVVDWTFANAEYTQVLLNTG